jgi:inorganic pyrophosphatase
MEGTVSKQGLLAAMQPFDRDDGALNVIIETPRGSRNKYKYDINSGLFKLNKVLPAGAVFPFDFGFVPSTAGDDGDPLDVLVILEEPAFAGCLVEARLLGVIEANQTKNGKTIRNDRFVACANKLKRLCDVKSLRELDTDLLDQIQHFFISYNQMEGREFKPLRLSSAAVAKKLIRAGCERFKKEESPGQ